MKGDWGLGSGDWDWDWQIGASPNSPIPNPLFPVGIDVAPGEEARHEEQPEGRAEGEGAGEEVGEGGLVEHPRQASRAW